MGSQHDHHTPHAARVGRGCRIAARGEPGRRHSRRSPSASSCHTRRPAPPMRWRASSPRSCRVANGWTVVVDNKPGASAALGSREVARAEPDGHTIILGTNQSHATNAILLKDPGYDPIADFVPIAGLADLQHALVVRKDLPRRVGRRADRARQEGPGQAQLRLDGSGLGLAPRHGAVQGQDRHADDARRLPRRRADGPGDRRRAHRRGLLDAAVGAGADPVGRHAGTWRSPPTTRRRSCPTCRC